MKVVTVEQGFNIMNDYVAAIQRLINDNVKTCEVYKEMIHLMENLEEFVKKDGIKDDGRGVSSYKTVINNAKTFMGMGG